MLDSQSIGQVMLTVLVRLGEQCLILLTGYALFAGHFSGNGTFGKYVSQLLACALPRYCWLKGPMLDSIAGPQSIHSYIKLNNLRLDYIWMSVLLGQFKFQIFLI